MTDMSHTQAEEALASGDEEDVAEAVEAERAESERRPRRPQCTTSTEDVDEVAAEQAEAVVEAVAEEIAEIGPKHVDAVEASRRRRAEAPSRERPSPTSCSMPPRTAGRRRRGRRARRLGSRRGRGEPIVEVESPYDRPGRWYVVHTYSGYENKVKLEPGEPRSPP